MLNLSSYKYHIITICLRIRVLKPKCGKCGLLHEIEDLAKDTNVETRQLDVGQDATTRSKILTHLIKGKIVLSPIETILSILGKLEFL
jgi:hypothetical protein